jgi:HEAT repeat protein
MKFDQPGPLSRDDLSRELQSHDATRIARALVAAALHESDGPFVESLIVQFLLHRDPLVRGVAAIAAGHVARIHGSLAVEQIVPLIERLLTDTRTNGQAQDALDDIRMFHGKR